MGNMHFDASDIFFQNAFYVTDGNQENRDFYLDLFNILEDQLKMFELFCVVFD